MRRPAFLFAVLVALVASGGLGCTSARTTTLPPGGEPALAPIQEYPSLATVRDTTAAPSCRVPSPYVHTQNREGRARWAARMDPGILQYTEPPTGTRMPTLSPDVTDRDMLLPGRP